MNKALGKLVKMQTNTHKTMVQGWRPFLDSHTSENILSSKSDRKHLCSCFAVENYELHFNTEGPFPGSLFHPFG